ncbi:MAG TPA: tetratricopeptide repeat protein [Nostocaceae cyanobacterium]|nr:tetratricopeptide repeat protein [Nostocaceae cyanobacterium]
MQSRKILALMLSLGLSLIPQISMAQSLEDLEKQAAEATERKNYTEAAKIWRGLIEKDQENSYAYIQLADVLASQGKIEETIAIYKQAVKLTPESSIYEKLADFLLEKGKTQEAIATYREAIKLDPKTDTAYFSLGKALLAVGNLPEALTVYQQLTKIQPNAISYKELADVLLQAGKREEAIATYKQALQLKPESYIAYGIYTKLGDILEYPEALAIFRQSNQNNSADEYYYKGLGELASKRGYAEDAITAYRQLIKLKPEEEDNYIYLADILVTQKKYNEAIVLYRQAVALNPSDYYHSKLSRTLAENGNLDEALTVCQQVIKLGEGSYDTCSYINLPLYKQQGLSGVTSFYQKFGNVIPRRQLAEIYVNLGYQLSYGEGAKQDAISFVREALKIDPGNKEAQNALKDLLN